MDEKKMQELMNDEEFVKQVISLKTEEEVQEAFKAKGVDISIEEIKKLGEEGKTALEDGALENVSGGSVLEAFMNGLFLSPFGAGVVITSERGFRFNGFKENATLAAGSLVVPVGCAVCGAMIYKAVEKRRNKPKK